MDLPQEIRFPDKDAAEAFLSDITNNEGPNIAGLDEAGRGPYAGPVVAACVLLPIDHGIEGIRDSKRVSTRKREVLADKIMETSVWAVGVRNNEDIDNYNIREASFQAAAEAVNKCIFAGKRIDYLLCDGGLHLKDLVSVPTTSIVKGDFWLECISAASIVAKVYRDRQMAIYHEFWPEYGFDSNQGYGTKFHRQAIETYGITPIHRRSYGICKTAKERGK